MAESYQSPIETTTLSRREKELVHLAARGMTDQGIAKAIGISPATVNSYWVRIRSKLGPYSRTELVAICLKYEADRMIRGLQDQNRTLLAMLRAQMEGQDSAFERGFAEAKPLIELAPHGIAMVTGDGILLDCNERFREIFGLGVENVAGTHISSLVAEDTRDDHAEFVSGYMANPDVRLMADHHAVPALRRDGTMIRICATLAPLPLAESLRVVLTVKEMNPNDD